MPYPNWMYFPRNSEAPPWVHQFVAVVADAEAAVSTAKASGLKSDDVLAEFAPGLGGLGFSVESGKRQEQRINRPVVFGENGVPQVSYDIDAFHDELGIAVEVEAGRGAANNADYRDILRTALILDARFLALVMPVDYRTGSTSVKAYSRTRAQLDALYASDRLKLPFFGVLLVGY